MSVTHIPGHLNVLADALSRTDKPVSTEWSLHRNVVTVLCRRFFEPVIDLFATYQNKQFPVFVSPFQDERAWKIDAMSFQWQNIRAYAFPLVGATLKQLSAAINTQLILIAPCWPDRPWFPELLSLLVDNPVQLPEWDNLLSQPRHGLHHNIPMLSLHAWNVSSDTSLIREYRQRLRITSRDPNEALQCLYTRATGNDSLVGVVQGLRIHSQPLRQL